MAAQNAKKELATAKSDAKTKLQHHEKCVAKLNDFIGQCDLDLCKRISGAAREKIKNEHCSIGSFAEDVRKAIEDAKNGQRFAPHIDHAAIAAAEAHLRLIETKLEKGPSLTEIRLPHEASLFRINQLRPNAQYEPESTMLMFDIDIAKRGVDTAKCHVNVARSAGAMVRLGASTAWLGDSIEQAEKELETNKDKLELIKLGAAELAVKKAKRAIEMVGVLEKAVQVAETGIGLVQVFTEDAGEPGKDVMETLYAALSQADYVGITVALERAMKTVSQKSSLAFIARLDEDAIPHANRLLFVENFLGTWLAYHGTMFTRYADPKDPPDARRDALLAALNRFRLKNSLDHQKLVKVLKELHFDPPAQASIDNQE